MAPTEQSEPRAALGLSKLEFEKKNEKQKRLPSSMIPHLVKVYQFSDTTL